MKRLKPSQISTAAKDPQVPGPGRNRPDTEKCRDHRRPKGRRAVCRLRPKLPPTQSSSSGPGKFCSSASSEISVTGEETTYCPLAHLPRSISRQRSLQKGKSSPALCHRLLANGTFQLERWIYQPHFNCRLIRRNGGRPRNREFIAAATLLLHFTTAFRLRSRPSAVRMASADTGAPHPAHPGYCRWSATPGDIRWLRARAVR